MKKIILSYFLIIAMFSSYAQDEKAVSVQSSFKTEIDKITKDKKIQKAFQVIEDLEPTTMKELIELTQIPAPPFRENKRAERYQQMLKEAGVDSIWTDEVGNVIALRKGKW